MTHLVAFAVAIFTIGLVSGMAVQDSTWGDFSPAITEFFLLVFTVALAWGLVALVEGA